VPSTFKGPSNEANVTEPAAGDGRVQSRIFVGIAAFFALTATLYWFTSYEDAGTTMLVLSAGLGGLAGGYLWVHDRRGAAAGAEHPGDGGGGGQASEEYLPHASVWPLGIGAGAFLLFNGLILGIWFLVPGVILVGVALVGYCAQSRRRD